MEKQTDEIYCQSCGKVIKKEAEVCVNCGVRQKKEIKNPKNKTTAILLAVFLGFWAWIYTWKIDYWKFWLALTLTILTMGWGAIAFVVWVIIDMSIRPVSFYEEF